MTKRLYLKHWYKLRVLTFLAHVFLLSLSSHPTPCPPHTPTLSHLNSRSAVVVGRFASHISVCSCCCS